MAFMVLLALINLRGVGESVKFNVVLTLVEITALAIVIGVGFWAIAQGDGDISRVTTFSSPEDKGVFLAVTAATAIAFFAMVGFDDSVNMVEECHDPERIFPRTMLTGLGIAVVIYVLVAFAVVAVLTPGELAEINEAEGRGAARGRQRGGARLPHRPGVPLPRRLRGRQHRSDQHDDGEPAALRPGQAGRAAAVAGQGLAEQPRALRGDRLLDRPGAGTDLVRLVACRERHRPQPGQHHGSAAARGLRGRQHRVPGPASGRARVPLQVPGADAGAGRGALPLPGRPVGRPDAIVYQIAGGLLAIGVVLWAITWLTNRGIRAKKTGFRDIEHLEDDVRLRAGGPRSDRPPARGVGTYVDSVDRVPHQGAAHAARPAHVRAPARCLRW